MAMDIYISVWQPTGAGGLARNCVATRTLREKKQQQSRCLRGRRKKGKGRGGRGGRKARKRRKAKGATLSPRSLFLFPFLPIPSRRVLRRLRSRVFFRLSFIVYSDRVDNRKEKEKEKRERATAWLITKETNLLEEQHENFKSAVRKWDMLAVSKEKPAR